MLNMTIAHAAYPQVKMRLFVLLLVVKAVRAESAVFLLDLQESNEQMQLLAQHRIHLVVAGLSVAAVVLMAFFLYAFWRKNRILRRLNEQLSLRVELIVRHGREPKYQRSRLTADDKELLAARIAEVLQQTDVICSADFSLQRLAELTGESKERVSQVVNECYGKNFNQLLGEYRVREACCRLTDIETYGGYTIEAIALSLGYRSRSNFASVFRRMTGMLPSEYQRISREKSGEGM